MVQSERGDMEERSAKRGIARGRAVLVVASFALAALSTVGFAFAIPPMIDARGQFAGVLAEAEMPSQQAGDAVQPDAAAAGSKGANSAARGEASSSLVAHNDAGADADAAGEKDAPKEEQGAEGEGADFDSEGDAEGEKAAGGESATAQRAGSASPGGTRLPAAATNRPSSSGSGAPAQPNAGSSDSSGSGSSDEPSPDDSSAQEESGPSAEELAEAEEAAQQERYRAAAHEFRETCLTDQDISGMLMICALNLPVGGYESGSSLYHTWWSSADVDWIDGLLNDCLSECSRQQATSFYSEEFPELNDKAQEIAAFWDNVRVAATAMKEFVNNYRNCWNISDACASQCSECTWPLEGHMLAYTYSGNQQQTMDSIEEAIAIWQRFNATWIWY